MNTNRQIRLYEIVLMTLGAGVLLAALMLVVGGCASMDKSVAVTVSTVDHAADVWAAYYVAALKDPTVDKVQLYQAKEKVERLYVNYQAAFETYDKARAAKDASTKQAAVKAMQDAASYLVVFIDSQLVKRPVTK